MRKILFISALGLLLAGSASAQQKKQETLEGNGKLVTRDVPVQSFDALIASGVYDLKLSQGDRETVKIEADENLQDLFQVHNEGSKLIIDMKKMEHKNVKLNDKNKMKVFVTFKKLKELELSNLGGVHSDDQLTFDNLVLENKCVGRLDLKLTANKLDLKNTSVGNV